MTSDELLVQVKEFLAHHPAKTHQDQFFLVDHSVIETLVAVAKVNKNDRVLEVGPGLGFLTRDLASEADEVVAIEIDKTFKPYLDKLPKKVEVIYGDAYRLLNSRKFRQKLKPPTKVVSSIPYRRAQNMLHNYTKSSWYQGDIVWLAPLSLINKVNREPILGAYFKARLIRKVPRSSFYPQPNTNSAIICFERISDPKETGNFEIYFRRWLYSHEHWKVKNALREGLITAAYSLKGLVVTKNEARKLIESLNMPVEEFEKLTGNIRPGYYFEIPQKLKGWFESL